MSPRTVSQSCPGLFFGMEPALSASDWIVQKVIQFCGECFSLNWFLGSLWLDSRDVIPRIWQRIPKAEAKIRSRSDVNYPIFGCKTPNSRIVRAFFLNYIDEVYCIRAAARLQLQSAHLIRRLTFTILAMRHYCRLFCLDIGIGLA